MRGGILFLAGTLTGFALASILFVGSPYRGSEGTSPAGVVSPREVERLSLPPSAPAPERLEAPRVAASDRDPVRSPARATEGDPRRALEFLPRGGAKQACEDSCGTSAGERSRARGFPSASELEWTTPPGAVASSSPFRTRGPRSLVRTGCTRSTSRD